MLANLNKTWHESLNGTKSSGNQNPSPTLDSTELTSEQIQTIVYIVLAFIIVTSVSIVSGLYMRSISEKRRSAAAIKSLLDLMAENRSLQSVYTMEGVYATASSQNEVSNHGEKMEDLPAILKVARHLTNFDIFDENYFCRKSFGCLLCTVWTLDLVVAISTVRIFGQISQIFEILGGEFESI